MKVASTCLGDFLISTPMTRIVTLHRRPVVFISRSRQRPNVKASLQFLSYPDADTSGYAELPKLGSETDGSSIETDAANNTVISSYVLHR